MKFARVHVIGAGLAGLAAAVRLGAAGVQVLVHEAAGHAGGRCRSFFDAKLERLIDNGNHLLLSGNRSALAYLSEIGAKDSLISPEGDGFSFFDLADQRRWTVPISLSCLLKVPGGRLLDYLGLARLSLAGPDDKVAELLDVKASVYRNFWQPLSVGLLNIAAEQGSALLLRSVFQETIKQGASACSPCVAAKGLSESFIHPALKMLKNPARFNHRLKALDFAHDRVIALDFGDEIILMAADDGVLLATPPGAAVSLIPGLAAPMESRAIVNAHFLLPEKRSGISMLGMVGGVSQWLFTRGDIASVTVSAADQLALAQNEEIAATLWREVSLALDLDWQAMPPWRIVKEKQATFAQTKEAIRCRPGPRSKWSNLFLAGDWTNTGLPATIEGAIRSGHNAATSILS